MSVVTQETEYDAHSAIGHPALLREIQDEWEHAVTSGPCCEPFFQPGWFNSYLSAFEPRATIQMISVREKTRLAALLPLVRETTLHAGIPLRAVRSAAGVHSCRFDVIRALEIAEPLLFHSIWNELARADGWDRLELRDVPQDSPSRALLNYALADGYRVGIRPSVRSPRIELPRDDDPEHAWGQLQSRLGSRFRTSLRQWRRRLEALGTVELRDHREPEKNTLEHFYALEKSGWKGRQRTAILDNAQTRAFYDAVVSQAAERGALRLYELSVDRKPVAMQLGLVMGETYFMPKVAYNEEYRACAPGHLLMQDVVHDCIRQQLRWFDCLGDADEWKCRWTRDLRAHEHWFIYPPGVRGGYFYAMDFPVRNAAKHVIHRLRRGPADAGN